MTNSLLRNLYLSKDAVNLRYPSYVLIGNYSDNIGDLAILSFIINNIKNYWSNSRIYVPSRNPIKIRHMFNVESNRPSLMIFSRLLTCNAIILSGGIFGDEIGPFGMVGLLFISLLSLVRKGIVFFYGCGVYLSCPIFRRIIFKVLIKTARKPLLFRNDSDRIMLPNKGVQLIDDLGVSIPSVKPIGLWYKPNSKYIIISIRPTKDQQKNNYISDCLYNLLNKIKEHKYKIVLLPFCYDDYFFLKSILHDYVDSSVELVNINRMRPEHIKWIIEKASIVIAMRLHAMLFTYAADKPMIAISYSRKTQNWLQNNKLYSVSIQQHMCKKIWWMFLDIEKTT